MFFCLVFFCGRGGEGEEEGEGGSFTWILFEKSSFEIRLFELN